jgi:hypothetical protein
MAYTTDTNVKKLLTSISPQTALNNIDFAFFIKRAENRINTKLAIRYNVPFVVVPPMVEDIATELTALFILRVFFTQAELDNSMWVKTFQESDIMLEDIATYKAKLVNADGTDVEGNTTLASSNTQDFAPIFDVDNIEDASVSKARLDSIDR